MTYAFEPHEPLGPAVRRVAEEELSTAIDELAGPWASDAELRAVVHDVRKRGKKVRGLIRLVRPALGQRYGPVNIAVRDAARLLSPIRDGHALLATYDHVVAARPEALAGTAATAAVRAGLRNRSLAVSREAMEEGGRMAQARAMLVEVRDGIPDWDVPDRFDKAAAAGLEDTYRRGARALAAVEEDATDEALHEWRKRAKYLWYQVRLLAPAAPRVLEPLAAAFHDLADTLGDDHDLAVLTAGLRHALDEFGGEARVIAVLAVLDEVRADLLRRALPLGHELYAEEPATFAARIGAYWAMSGNGDGSLAAGSIETLWPASDGLDRLGRDELYRRAQQLGVTGRSQMSRDELRAAVRAGRPPA